MVQKKDKRVTTPKAGGLVRKDAGGRNSQMVGWHVRSDKQTKKHWRHSPVILRMEPFWLLRGSFEGPKICNFDVGIGGA